MSEHLSIDAQAGVKGVGSIGGKPSREFLLEREDAGARCRLMRKKASGERGGDLQIWRIQYPCHQRRHVSFHIPKTDLIRSIADANVKVWQSLHLHNITYEDF